MKARVQFTKTGSMRFLGHLDVMRYMQKLFRRTGLNVTYSQGFHPHPVLSFASPLGLGLTSEGEYLDVELNSLEGKTADEWVGIMNGESNGEIAFRNMVLLKEEAKPSMSLLAAADYEISGKEGCFVGGDGKERFREFLSQDSIVVVKKTKKSEKEIDLMEYVYDIMEGERKESLAVVRLAAGSVVNVKPELLLEAFCRERGVDYQASAYRIRRLEMYADVNAAKGEVNSNGRREKRKLLPLLQVDVGGER